jgi:hypothetical protein
MSWFKWKRPGLERPPSPPVVEIEEPEPLKTSLLEKIGKWRAHYAAERQAVATAEQIERARDEAQARRQAAIEDEFARSIARRGYVWPGESADDDGPARQGPSVLPNSLGGFWIRW